MLTMFGTPKPFNGHIGVIQRNALKSWTLLHPDVEVILFGDEKGAAEVCRDLGIRHEPEVRRNEYGTKYLNDMFDRAAELSRHPFLCYANCDIMLLPSFCRAVERVSTAHSKFLMAGCRWDIDITEPWDFSLAWDERLRSMVESRGMKKGLGWIDYFCFSRELYRGEIPPLVVGRCWWDQWLIWKAKKLGAAVIDSTGAVLAVHQNHDYSYHPEGFKGTLEGEEAMANRRLAGGKWHLYTLMEATHQLGPDEEKRHWGHSLMPYVRTWWNPLWYSFLSATLPARRRLKLQRAPIMKALGRDTVSDSRT